ncbi:unnamed protein product [Rhizoctonia solani]|uniref:Vegetative incompatibility protein HET-E-1 n=1 Tax=Rhizoctonia solani TaxID=456999 RepID=A0A8H3AAE2_9AGAM|nr:unnamed protein product [Rhizoctonia solani]
MELYLRSELSFVSPSRAEIDLLAQRSGSLFIYATTLVRYIQAGKRLADPNKRLKSVLSMIPEATREHSQIDALYTIVLESALNEEELVADEAKDIRVVMRTLLFTQEPISIETIATLAGVDDLKRVRSALEPLRPVLHHSEETGLVSTLHASFRDFMLDEERSGAHFCRIVEQNRMLAERCFIAMEEHLRFNICNLESSFIPDDKVNNIQRRIQEGILPDLTYACRHWASHLALAFKSDTLLTMLAEFMRHRLLFWMEVLNLRREMDTGVVGLLKVKQWLNQAESTSYELMVLVEDARNFVTDFAGSAVSQSTPHIYISLLPFCSRSSSVFKHYWKRMQGLLELHGSLMEHKETMALATWDVGSEVYSVAYSPDGTRVAVGCEKGGTRILDAHDGTQLVCLSQDDSHGANSVVYSPDGKLLASGHGGKDCSFRVWDARNGALIAHPHSCASDIHCASFSPDSARVAFGSYGKDVYIWNVQLPCEKVSGYLVKIVQKSSISTKGTIHLWKSHDGTPATSPLQGHTGHVMSLVFTPDGTRLVSGSEDKTIRIWNVSLPSGQPLGKFPTTGHSSRVHLSDIPLVFAQLLTPQTVLGSSLAPLIIQFECGTSSPERKRISSLKQPLPTTRANTIPEDHTQQILGTADAYPLSGSLKGHKDPLTSSTVSTNNAVLVTGFGNGLIRVWDLQKVGLVVDPFHGHGGEVTSLLLSFKDTDAWVIDYHYYTSSGSLLGINLLDFASGWPVVY